MHPVRSILLLSALSVLALACLTAAKPAGKSENVLHQGHAIHQTDVIIDAGHGGIDGGTHWGEIKESHINLAIGRKLYLLLNSRGIQAILNRTGDYALSDDNRWHRSRSRHQRDLTQRRSLQDEVAATMLVSIHVNWAPRGGQRGPLVIYRKGDARSALLAMHLQDSLNRQQSIRQRRPQPSDRYYLLNYAKIPSVIVETAFLSNPQDRAMLTSPRGQTLVAEAIASGIMAYLALTPDEPRQWTPVPTSGQTALPLARPESPSSAHRQ
jgi:N-acetylmuramoyl-L-alanine amidase